MGIIQFSHYIRRLLFLYNLFEYIIIFFTIFIGISIIYLNYFIKYRSMLKKSRFKNLYKFLITILFTLSNFVSYPILDLCMTPLNCCFNYNSGYNKELCSRRLICNKFSFEKEMITGILTIIAGFFLFYIIFIIKQIDFNRELDSNYKYSRRSNLINTEIFTLIFMKIILYNIIDQSLEFTSFTNLLISFTIYYKIKNSKSFIFQKYRNLQLILFGAYLYFSIIELFNIVIKIN